MRLLLITVAFILVSMAVGFVWFFVRPLLVACGMIPPTADDYVVGGWKAERRGQWAAALLAYCEALQIDPQHPDAKERRDALLAALPELTDEETVESVLAKVQRQLTARVAVEEEEFALQTERNRQKSAESDAEATFWLGELIADENGRATENSVANPDTPSESPRVDEGADHGNAPPIEEHG